MDSLRLAYLSLFGLAAMACFLAAWRARHIADRDTQTGLIALFLLTGTWGAASFGRLLPYSTDLQTAFYMVGLVVGLASVGAWLYFCSAYTGNDYHRSPGLRTLAVTVFVVISAVKLTNPVHELYFSTTTSMTPFPHMVIDVHPVHWVVTGLAYSLSAVGFYLLYELFSRSRFDTRPLAVLVAITGVPAVVDFLAYTETVPSLLLKFNFEPVGVAIFAVGVLFVVDDTFVAVPRFWRQHVLEHLDEAIIVLDRDDRLRDYNAAAAAMFPAVTDAIGESLDTAVPALVPTVAGEDDILELDHQDEHQFYRVRSAPLTDGSGHERGRILICADVTDIERQRRDLQRHTDQFDDFAEAITHELRNAVTLVDGYLDLVAEGVADDADGSEEVPIDQVSEAVGRMHSVIGDLTTLARYSQPVETVGPCDIETAVSDAWNGALFAGLTYEVTNGGAVEAHDRRLEELFHSVFGFAAANGATHVVIDPEADAIVVTTDGTWLSEPDSEKAFAYGEPVPSAAAGMALPNVRMLARGLGWHATIDTAYTDGVRLRIEDVKVI